MRAKQAETAAAWENPLIPNARLRQIYLAMAQARMLARALPASRRGQTVGLEAALVSTAVDLRPCDLASDALTGGVVEWLRGATLKDVLRAGKATAPRRRIQSMLDGKRCAAVAQLPAAGGVAERIWMALGAAAVLKAAAARARADAKTAEEAEGATTQPAGLVVVYTLPGELPTALWKKALSSAAEQELPILFVALPAARVGNGKARAMRSGGVSALALGCGVPGIAVDADDAVAIYRVAQESIGHARIGGGAALIECVPFVLEGAAGKRSAENDALAGLERYMVQRGVATKAWMEREAKAFARRLAR